MIRTLGAQPANFEVFKYAGVLWWGLFWSELMLDQLIPSIWSLNFFGQVLCIGARYKNLLNAIASFKIELYYEAKSAATGSRQISNSTKGALHCLVSPKLSSPTNALFCHLSYRAFVYLVQIVVRHISKWKYRTSTVIDMAWLEIWYIDGNGAVCKQYWLCSKRRVVPDARHYSVDEFLQKGENNSSKVTRK